MTGHDSPSGGGPEEYGQPPYQLATWSTIGAAVLGVLLLFSVRCDLHPTQSRDYQARTLAAEPAPLLLPPPAANDEYFPCSDCHEGEPPNREVRELEDEHDTIRLEHGTLWCLHCHDGLDNDHLRLADEQLIDYEESWRLCTQCHGKKLEDWRLGIHGKRMGHWYGPKEYWSCVQCHNPHTPKFRKLKPEPPPARPAEITLEGWPGRGGSDVGH